MTAPALLLRSGEKYQSGQGTACGRPWGFFDFNDLSAAGVLGTPAAREGDDERTWCNEG
jgi:hypothetical protein